MLEEVRDCRIHGKYIYPRWTRCMLCPPYMTEPTGDQVIGSEAAAGREAPRKPDPADNIRQLEFEDSPDYDFRRGAKRIKPDPADKFFTQLSDRRGSEETVNHPQHYGGDTPTEPIKVIRAWTLGFNLGNAVKYIARAGKKGSALEDLKKARWYLDDEIKAIEGVPEQPATFLGLTGIAEIQRQENQRMNAQVDTIAKGPVIP